MGNLKIKLMEMSKREEGLKLKIINDLLDFNDDEIRSYIHAVIFWGFTQNVEGYTEAMQEIANIILK